MEEGHYHHHHHHHGHHTTQSESESTDQRAETISGISTDQQAETISRISDQHADNFSRTSEQQQYAVGPAPAPVLVPRPPNAPSSGVQPTSSFHSVSSMDSSAEMAKYFPGAQTPGLSPFRHHQDDDDQQTQSVATTTTAFTNTNTVASGPYINVPGPHVVQQQQQYQNYQSAQAPAIIPQPQQVVHSANPQLPSGIPSYSSQIEGISVSQTVVNDVLIDLQTKVINDTQQQYQNDSSDGNYFEPLSPIYIRAPNPTIILRSDLHHLRAQLAAQQRPPSRPTGGFNQFQRPSFPSPH